MVVFDDGDDSDGEESPINVVFEVVVVVVIETIEVEVEGERRVTFMVIVLVTVGVASVVIVVVVAVFKSVDDVDGIVVVVDVDIMDGKRGTLYVSITLKFLLFDGDVQISVRDSSFQTRAGTDLIIAGIIPVLRDRLRCRFRVLGTADSSGSTSMRRG